MMIFLNMEVIEAFSQLIMGISVNLKYLTDCQYINNKMMKSEILK